MSTVRLYDAVARGMRALPAFRGKWQAVGVMHRFLLPLVPREERVRLATMQDRSLMMWDVSDPSEAHAYWLGRYDNALRDAILPLLPPHAVVLDVGANVGGWTVPLARALRSRGGLVVAFEPVPSNRARLQDAIARNGVGAIVRVEDVALGDAAAEVGMWLRSSVTGATTGTAAVTRDGGQLRVQMLTLDQWMRTADLPRLDFMKLDIEGAELLLLRGGEDTVKTHRPLVLAEFNTYWMSTFGLTVADASAWAAEHDYDFFQWDPRATRFVRRAPAGAEQLLLMPRERQDQLLPR